MPPLLCLGPQLLDHSFPRSDVELHVVADTLADVDELRIAGIAHLALPDTLASFVAEIDWSAPNPQGRLRDVYQYLTVLFTQPATGVERVDVDCVKDATPHPIPLGCQSDGWVDEWAEEVGRLLRRHDRSLLGNGYFIGVFAGSLTALDASYGSGSGQLRTDRCFPLIDTGRLADLEDAYVWDVPTHYTDRVVKPRDVISNYRAIGATALGKPHRDGHYDLTFPDGQKWSFSQSWTEIGENAIAELKRLTGLPSIAVKYALCEGKDPRVHLKPLLRLEMCSGCDACPKASKPAKRRKGSAHA